MSLQGQFAITSAHQERFSFSSRESKGFKKVKNEVSNEKSKYSVSRVTFENGCPLSEPLLIHIRINAALNGNRFQN